MKRCEQLVLENGLVLEGGVYSLAKHETPQYIAAHRGMSTIEKPNGDYAEFNRAGLLLADGEGSCDEPGKASQLAIMAVTRRALELRVPSMPLDEAVDAVNEGVLPYADTMLKRYLDDHPNIRRLSTTLEGLLVARDGLVSVGIGDSSTIGYRPGHSPLFFEVTQEQQIDDQITNTLEGKGRLRPNNRLIDQGTGKDIPPELTHDQVRPIVPQAGDILIELSDGTRGKEEDCSRLPLEPYVLGNVMSLRAPTAEDAARNLVTLPYRIEQTGAMVWSDRNECWIYYAAPQDDATAGVLRVSRQQS